MTLAFDSHADALYIGLAPDRAGKIARTVAIDDSTNVDLDSAGNLLGIEVLEPGSAWPLAEILRRYEVSDEDAAMLMMGYPFAFAFSAA